MWRWEGDSILGVQLGLFLPFYSVPRSFDWRKLRLPGGQTTSPLFSEHPTCPTPHTVPFLEEGHLDLAALHFSNPWRRKWKPTPVFLPGESHTQRSMMGYSPWGRKESDMTEDTAQHFSNITTNSLCLRSPCVLSQGRPEGTQLPIITVIFLTSRVVVVGSG